MHTSCHFTVCVTDCVYKAALDLLLCIKLRYAHILSFDCLCHRCLYNSALNLFIRTKLLFHIPYKNDRMAKRTMYTSCHFTVLPVILVVTSCLFSPNVVRRTERVQNAALDLLLRTELHFDSVYKMQDNFINPLRKLHSLPPTHLTPAPKNNSNNNNKQTNKQTKTNKKEERQQQKEDSII